MVAPNSPRARAKREQRARQHAAPGQRKCDREEHAPFARAEGSGDLFEGGADLLHGGPRRANEQWKGHHAEREHDGFPGEDDIHSKSVVQPAAEKAAASEQLEQDESGDDRGQHDGQRNERFDKRLAGPVPPREHPRQRQPGRQDQQRARHRHPG